jgi:alkylated DNA repair protein alkB family protein 8
MLKYTNNLEINKLDKTNLEINKLDKTNLDTYEKISQEFSETRAYVWKCVKDFIPLINPNNHILEIGCGNGKNMEYILKNIDCKMIGIDTCQNFVDICKGKNLEVYNNNILNLNFDSNSFDCVLCIAMFHHLLTKEDQENAMKEILRIMKPGGFCIITCWSTEQPESNDVKKFKFNVGINIVPWKGRQQSNKIRYYYVYSEKMFRDFFEQYSEIKICNIYNEVGNWIILFQKN